RELSEVPADFGPGAVAIGKFDGVHSGHRAVLGRLVGRARERGLVSVVVTFDRNPLEVVAPERCPEALVSLEQKLDLQAGTGVDATLVLHFDRQLADVSAEHFVARYLVNALHAKLLLVGSD